MCDIVKHLNQFFKKMSNFYSISDCQVLKDFTNSIDFNKIVKTVTPIKNKDNVKGRQNIVIDNKVLIQYDICDKYNLATTENNNFYIRFNFVEYLRDADTKIKVQKQQKAYPQNFVGFLDVILKANTKYNFSRSLGVSDKFGNCFNLYNTTKQTFDIQMQLQQNENDLLFAYQDLIEKVLNTFILDFQNLIKKNNKSIQYSFPMKNIIKLDEQEKQNKLDPEVKAKSLNKKIIFNNKQVIICSNNPEQTDFQTINFTINSINQRNKDKTIQPVQDIVKNDFIQESIQYGIQLPDFMILLRYLNKKHCDPLTMDDKQRSEWKQGQQIYQELLTVPDKCDLKCFINQLSRLDQSYKNMMQNIFNQNMMQQHEITDALKGDKLKFYLGNDVEQKQRDMLVYYINVNGNVLGNQSEFNSNCLFYRNQLVNIFSQNKDETCKYQIKLIPYYKIGNRNSDVYSLEAGYDDENKLILKEVINTCSNLKVSVQFTAYSIDRQEIVNTDNDVFDPLGDMLNVIEDENVKQSLEEDEQ